MTSRLGDDIDDFCIKCKRLTNHSVVSLLEDQPAKVRCRTCYHDHDFRNGEPLPSKKDLKKAALFEAVLGAKGDADPADLPIDEDEDPGEEAAAVGDTDEADAEAPPKPAKNAAKKASKRAGK